MNLLSPFFICNWYSRGVIRRTQAVAEAVHPNPAQGRRMKRAQQESNVDTRQLRHNPPVRLYSIWPFWAEPCFSTEHLSLRVPAKQMAHCIIEEILIKGLFTRVWHAKRNQQETMQYSKDSNNGVLLSKERNS